MDHRSFETVLGVFRYASHPHIRRHGPRGYSDYTAFKPWLRDEFMFRCVYCLDRERWSAAGADRFGVDHVIPQSVNSLLVCKYDNLVYACNGCNTCKGDHLVNVDPCQITLANHIAIEEDGSIRHLTSDGKRIIAGLRLDRADLTRYRKMLLETLYELVKASERSDHSMEVLKSWLGFPEYLPDLRSLRPPLGNSRPSGLRDSFHEQQRGGMLPAIY